MKDKTHPEYKETTVTCACGNVIHTRSTKQNIRVEICSSCHPFFTGKQKMMDSAGRVEKFRKKYKDVKLASPKKASAKEPPKKATPDKATLKSVSLKQTPKKEPKEEPKK